jgi:hypothetical protein
MPGGQRSASAALPQPPSVAQRKLSGGRARFRRHVFRNAESDETAPAVPPCQHELIQDPFEWRRRSLEGAIVERRPGFLAKDLDDNGKAPVRPHRRGPQRRQVLLDVRRTHAADPEAILEKQEVKAGGSEYL